VREGTEFGLKMKGNDRAATSKGRKKVGRGEGCSAKGVDKGGKRWDFGFKRISEQKELEMGLAQGKKQGKVGMGGIYT